MLMFLMSSAFAEKIKVLVPGMTCQMCVLSMKKNFGNAVENPKTDILVNLENKTVLVTTKKDVKLTDKEIMARVVEAGYEAKKIIRLK